VAYQNYAGAWLQQSDANYDWLSNQWQPVSLSPGVDTVKIWQSFTLPYGANNLIVFGDSQYVAGNDQDNVLRAEASKNTLYGGRGDDVFIGSGGSGTNFVVAQGEGDKVIQNFTEGADNLRLIGGSLTTFDAVRAAMTQQGSDVVLNDGGTMILFRNANIGQFQAKDFSLPLNYSTLGNPTFNESFDNSSTIGANWKTNYGYSGTGLNSYTLTNNGEMQLYTDANFKGTSGSSLGLNPFSFNNGVLTISATSVNDWQSQQMWGYHYSSGMLESNFTQTYGYFEMRAALPQGQGLWPAFWMLGENNKEIDVLEALGSDLKNANNAMHSPDVPQYGNASFNPYTIGFHTYGVMWTPQTLTYYVDGSPVWSAPTPADMNSPMHLIVNLAVGGAWPGAPDSTPPVTTPPPSGAGQVLTASYAGAALVGGSGADTLNASQGADTLTGGAGADAFVFKAMPWSAGHITDFQVGVDKLDISALYAGGYQGADPVADGYVSFVVNGAGGTTVLLDTDGPGWGNTIKFQIAQLDGVSPAGLTAAQVFGGASTSTPGAPSTPPASGAGQVLTAAYPGATLAGGSGADTLNASQGPDTLTGGAGADHFVFNNLPWSSGHITDFTPGTDVLDLRPLFAAAHYQGGDPIADRYLQFVSDGAGGTKVLFDSDGWGSGNPWPITVTTLDGVAPSSVHSSDFMVH